MQTEREVKSLNFRHVENPTAFYTSVGLGGVENGPGWGWLGASVTQALFLVICVFDVCLMHF